MAENIAGDLVRKSKVFLFPFFLYCEKHICCRSCCKSFDVRHRRRKGRVLFGGALRDTQKTAAREASGKVDRFSSAGFSDQWLE